MYFFDTMNLIKGRKFINMASFRRFSSIINHVIKYSSVVGVLCLFFETSAWAGAGEYYSESGDSNSSVWLACHGGYNAGQNTECTACPGGYYDLSGGIRI